MPRITGKACTVKGNGGEITPCGAWTLEHGGATPSFVDNTTGGGKTRIAGFTDSTGTFEWGIDTGGFAPLAMHGEGTLELHIDDSDGHYISVPIIITGVPMALDPDTEEPIGINYQFGQTANPTYYGALLSSGI